MATLAVRQEAVGMVLAIGGQLDSASCGAIWYEACRAAEKADRAVLDVSALDGCDVTGAVLLAELAARPGMELRGARPQVRALLDRVGGIGAASAAATVPAGRNTAPAAPVIGLPPEMWSSLK